MSATSLLALLPLLGLQEPQSPELAAVLAAQRQRAELIAKVTPSVCAVMSADGGGGGSGVLIDAAGFVLTNYHVIGGPAKDWKAPKPPEGLDEDAQRKWREDNVPQGKNQYADMRVGLPDGHMYRAEVIGVDPGSDLGILKLHALQDGQVFPCSPLGDSDLLLVGETVLAMGNPFLLATDFTPTVTFGIVSGTHRYQEGQGNRVMVYPDCVQVDAPVNPGNSGGPLFNERGEVIGINGRISIGDRGRVNVGVGFAISSNQAKNFLGDLMAGRHAEHGTLDMSTRYIDAPHEEGRRGVFVHQIFRDAVAAAAGINLGDEITTFNGHEVRSANQLATMLGVLPSGTWVSIGFRPASSEGGYGKERTTFVRMATLDTGSQTDVRADTERLASRNNRRIATAAVIAAFGKDEAVRTATTYSRTHPGGERTTVTRQGERLRLDFNDFSLLRDDAGKCTAIRDGKTTDATLEETELLNRWLRADPFLRSGEERRKALDGALLCGGVHACGRPVWSFELPGDGELKTYYSLDGQPAGFVLRDPVRRMLIEHQVGACVDGKHEVRLILDGALQANHVQTAVSDRIDAALLGGAR